MSEPLQEVPVQAKQHPALAKIAAILAAICDLGILAAALAHVAVLASLCVLLLLVAGVLGLIALFLRGKKWVAVIAAINGLALAPVIVMLAIPNLRHVRARANEVSAIQSLQVIHEAEMQYNTMYPANGYACSLSALGGNPASGPASAQAAQIIQADLAGGQKAGYKFTISNCTRTAVNGQETFTTYQVTAVPVTVGKTGQNGYCLDMNGDIKKDPTGGTNCTAPY